MPTSDESPWAPKHPWKAAAEQRDDRYRWSYPETGERVLTIADVEELKGVSHNTVVGAIHRHELKVLEPRVTESAVEEWIQERRTPPADQARAWAWERISQVIQDGLCDPDLSEDDHRELRAAVEPLIAIAKRLRRSHKAA